MRHFRYCSTLSSVDVVTLAKRDGAFHITEKMFIKQVSYQAFQIMTLMK